MNMNGLVALYWAIVKSMGSPGRLTISGRIGMTATA